MIDKIKRKISAAKKSYDKSIAIKKKENLEKEAEKLRQEEKNIEDQKRYLETEKEKLLEMSSRELMVELITAIRGFYTRFHELEKTQEELKEKLENVEIELTTLEAYVSDLENDIGSTND